MRSDFKPARRIVDPNAGIEKVRGEGRCRICKRKPSGHPLHSLNRAHLVSRGQRGDDVDANIIPLCGSGVSGCHGVLTSHHRDGSTGMTYEEAATGLREALREDEVAYVTQKKSQAWLDRTYPKRRK